MRVVKTVVAMVSAITVIGIALILWTAPVAAATRTAATCNSGDVQTAVNSAQAGDTVVIPAGICTWTTPVSWTAPANVVLQGSGTSAVVGGGDITVIIDNITRNINTCSPDPAALSINLPSSGVFRMSGFTIRGGGTGSCNGTVRIYGGATYPQARIDHMHFDVLHSNVALVLQGVSGVADHIRIDAPAGPADNGIRALGVDATFGDVEWASATNFGTAAGWFYVEDSTFNNGIINDCFTGGKQVFRFNTGIGAGLQHHGTGHATRNRACRATEVYGNTFTSGPSAMYTATSTYGGPYMAWGNNASGFSHFLSFHNTRRNLNTYNNNGGGWGLCGTAFGPSNWDQNQDAAGRACLDQGGRGIGDRISGSTPSNTVLGGTAWPRQTLEPIYDWLNTTILTGSYFDEPDALYVRNQDFYLRSDGLTNCAPNAATCSQGVGVGTRAQRPVNCVAGPGGNTPGVAWWSTDQGGNWNTTNGTANDGTLDVCTATNTWTNGYYTPLTYPHPLVSGAPQGSTPGAPSNPAVR